MDGTDTIQIEPTAMELAAVGLILQMFTELVGPSGIPGDIKDHLESFSAKVIQALEPTVYKGE